MNEDYQQEEIVEGIDLEDKPGVTDKVLLLAALLISLPIYLTLLFLFDDPALSGHYGSASGYGSGSAAPPRIPVKGLAGMRFTPQQLSTINSEEELIKELVCTFEPKSGPLPALVYLRSGTYEHFSANGMQTALDQTFDKSWPDFGFPVPISSLRPAQTADLQFFCNYEEKLLHVPALRKLAGPLKFSAMGDGSILLEKTIAVGDEFEIEYLPQSVLAPDDVIGEVAAGSPYLSTAPLFNADLLEIANRAAKDAAPGAPTVLQIANFLETQGEYKADHLMKSGEHPVREFLLQSMTGHCQHFSAALVLLCRLRGIPARVANGYATDKKRDGRFFVTSGMAHAWVEILTADGWKIVDPQPQRGGAPPPITDSLALPQISRLNELREKLKQENAQRFAPQSSDKEDGEQELEPPRMPQRELDSNQFERPQTPGTVVENPARAEKHQREEAEKQFKKQSRDYTKMVKSALRLALALLLITFFCWLAIRKFEKLLKWLQKLFSRKAAADEPIQQNADELRQNIDNLLKMSGFVLEGCNVIKLFNDFTAIMAERGRLPRNEHETPGEYFERICLDLNLRPADGQAAARCFEAELYGGYKTDTADTKKFLQFLQQILTRLN